MKKLLRDRMLVVSFSFLVCCCLVWAAAGTPAAEADACWACVNCGFGTFMCDSSFHIWTMCIQMGSQCMGAGEECPPGGGGDT